MRLVLWRRHCTLSYLVRLRRHRCRHRRIIPHFPQYHCFQNYLHYQVHLHYQDRRHFQHYQLIQQFLQDLRGLQRRQARLLPQLHYTQVL